MRTAPVETELDVEKAKILLVDDQPENLFSAEAVLERLGQEVIKAQSGREALRHLLEDDFAVILLDVMMPGMDGFETASLIRSRERSRYTPIIFITALGKSEEHLFRGYDAGAVDYLTKPVIPEVLRSKVAVFVELSKKSAMLKRQADILHVKNIELEQAIAQLRVAEDEIRLLNLNLEKRVRELSAANKELDAFSYTVSHDLRAPLIRMDGFTRALLEQYGGKLDAQGQVYLDRVRSASQRMCQLVDDLLDFSRASRAELRVDRVDLSDLVRGIVADLRSRVPERTVECVIEDGVTTLGDPGLLRVALVNLLENAWKFTRKQPHAKIEFGRTLHNGTTAFFVRDNGAGFDPAYAHKLFTPFDRLHSAADFEGTGIGLATVERIIRRHGGRIWGEGELQHGAVFYFTLQSGWVA